MGAEKRRRFRPDPRTWLLLCLLGVAAILVIRSEIGCLCLFLACLLIHLLAGNGGKILPYGLYYLIFYGIGWLGVHLMDSGVAFSVSSMLSSIGIVSRKVLVPLSFAICLAGEPTGSLMAALQKLHLPKAAGIGTAVVLRFFPTITGEYQAIRSSQRFRGIGVGAFVGGHSGTAEQHKAQRHRHCDHCHDPHHQFGGTGPVEGGIHQLINPHIGDNNAQPAGR